MVLSIAGARSSSTCARRCAIGALDVGTLASALSRKSLEDSRCRRTRVSAASSETDADSRRSRTSKAPTFIESSLPLHDATVRTSARRAAACATIAAREERVARADARAAA